MAHAHAMQVDVELNGPPPLDAQQDVIAFGRNFVASTKCLSVAAAQFILQHHINPIYNAPHTHTLQPHVTQAILPKTLTREYVVRDVAPNAAHYLVSLKCDGVRAWLLVLAHPARLNEYLGFFVNRAGHVSLAPPCLTFAPDRVAQLYGRVNMLLFDGELLVSTNRTDYVIFDVLAINHTSHVVAKCSFDTRLRMVDTLLAKTGLAWQHLGTTATLTRKHWMALSDWVATVHYTAPSPQFASDGWVICHKNTPPFVSGSGAAAPPRVYKLKTNHTIDLWCCFDASAFLGDWYSASYYSHDHYMRVYAATSSRSSSSANVYDAHLPTCGTAVHIPTTRTSPAYVIYNAMSLYSAEGSATCNMRNWLREMAPQLEQQAMSSDSTDTVVRAVVEFQVLARMAPTAVQAHFDTCATCRASFANAHHAANIMFLDAEPIRARTDKSAANNELVLRATLHEGLNPSMSVQLLQQLVAATMTL